MKQLSVALLLVLALVAFGCKTTDNGISNNTVVKPVVIDDPTHGVKPVPDWIYLSQSELQNQSEYKDVYVFNVVQQGKSLEGTKTLASDFQIAGDIANMVSKRIETKFAGALAGTADSADAYFEKIVKSLASANLPATLRASM